MFRVNHCFRNRFTDTTHFLTSFWIFTSWDWLCFWCFFFRCCWSSFYCCWSLSCCYSLSTICKCIDVSFYDTAILTSTSYFMNVYTFFTSVFTNRWHSNYALIYYFCSCCWSSFRCWSFYCCFFSFWSFIMIVTFKFKVFVSRSIKFN
ncbi:Uncharacterised protein [Streptococcus pneumoniae]|nr:Uncharacterised protein [Streptococcus pneumoniae]